MTRVRWSRRAVRDLVEIGDFIAADSSVAARRWVERIRERAARAASAPRSGRIVPELGRDDVREVLLKSYRIVYRVAPREIAVVTVFEGHRQLPSDVDVDG